MQNAVAAASANAVLCLPDTTPTVTWATPVTFNTKAITIVGAAGWQGGANDTSIICTGRCFEISSTTTAVVALRIAYFTLNSESSETFQMDSDAGGEAVRGFRIDHIVRTNNSGGIVNILAGWGTSTSAMKGLFDHITCYDCRFVWFGEPDTTGGRYRWTEDDDLGTDEAVYVEDTQFIGSSNTESNNINQVDGNWGARYVFRFDTVTKGRFEAHGVQGNTGRAVRMFQFYYNDFAGGCTGTVIFRYIFVRGGTALIFHNRTDGCDTVGKISLDSARVHQGSTDAAFASETSIIGPCDGTSLADENSSGGEGYACLDQPGTSKDPSLWNFTGAHPVQAKRPWYLWENRRTTDSAIIGWELNCVGTAPTCTRQSTKIILANRDIYDTVASFDGTTGVGEGALASRPATCTTGVAYWATDQGSWNISSSNPYGVQANGADGVLYRCTATNTWSSDFTPLQYPHPYQSR